MRAVPEAGFEVHVRDLPVVFRKQPVGVVEPLFKQPFLRRQRTDLREVALKGREASAGVGRELFERQILSEIRFL